MKPFARFDMKVPVKVFQEDEMFISYCPVFDISSQGYNEENAKANLIEALTGFLMVCYEMGSLFDVLKEAGFVPGRDEQPEPPGESELPRWIGRSILSFWLIADPLIPSIQSGEVIKTRERVQISYK